MPTSLAIIPTTVARGRLSEQESPPHPSVRELWTPQPWVQILPGHPPPPPPQLAAHGSSQHSLPEFPAMGPHPQAIAPGDP